MEKKKREKRVVFLSGKKVNLRPLDAETDLEKVTKWINDQDIIKFLYRFTPATKREEKEWFEKKRENDVVLAIETKNGSFIGTIGLHKIDYMNGVAEVGILIGIKENWSKGYGFDAEMTLLNWGFTELNLRKIMHPAFYDNKASVNLAKKCGGVKEGFLKKHVFRGGKYRDMFVQSIYKNKWQKIWNEYIKSKGGEKRCRLN